MCRVKPLSRRPEALLHALDKCEQLVALPDATPPTFVEPFDDAGCLELLECAAYGDVRLARKRLSDRYVDHGLCWEGADQLASS